MNTSSNCCRCHYCGSEYRDTTMPEGEQWAMRTRGKDGEFVIRSADMSGCPVLWCDKCGTGVIDERADSFIADVRARLFSDMKYKYPGQYPSGEGT